jgi:hypothetical protein
MRALKFRVYIPDHGQFSYFRLGEFDYSDRYLHQHQYPVQEFIGMFDIKGREIYEGDVVQYNNKSNWDGVDLKVLWNEDNLAWEFLSKKEGRLEQSRLMKYRKEGNHFYDRVEVVGNIIENNLNA